MIDYTVNQLCKDNESWLLFTGFDSEKTAVEYFRKYANDNGFPVLSNTVPVKGDSTITSRDQGEWKNLLQMEEETSNDGFKAGSSPAARL